MKYLAASLLGLLILGTAGTAHAEAPAPDPFDGIEVELPPDFPPLPLPPTPGPIPFPGPFPFPDLPDLPGLPFPGPGDFGLPTGNVSADLYVECSLADPNVWVQIDNTTDDPAVATVDSPLMEPQLVVVAPHDHLVVPVVFDHVEHDTVGATVEFDGATILDDEQSIACLAPNPSYEFHYDCGSETAAVTLTNGGLLPAEMGYEVAPDAPNMHTINPGGAKEVTLPHGDADYLVTELSAEGEIMFHGVGGFDCPDVVAPADPGADAGEPPSAEADTGDDADEPTSGEADTPVDEPTPTPDSGKLADDSEPVSVSVDTSGGDDESTNSTEDSNPQDNLESEGGEDTPDAPDGNSGSRSPLPALALVTLLGVGGVAGATAWGRR